MAFKDVLKTLRKKKGLTQAELAKLTNLSVSAISMYENGNREPNYETLELLADFFNVDMNSILAKVPENNITISPFRKSLNLSSREVNLINEYRKLPPTGKCEVDKYVGYLRTQYSDSQPKAKS